MRSALFATVAMTGLLVGSGPNGPTCSSDTVTKIVKQIALREMKKDAGALMFDLDKTTLDVAGIRTVTTEKLTCSCAAVLKVHFVLSDEVKRQSDFKMPDTTDNDITYTATVTDDGKDVYVNVKGL